MTEKNLGVNDALRKAGFVRIPAWWVTSDELKVIHQMAHKDRTSRQSATMTPELADEIRRYAIGHPNLSNQRIANHFNVNPGRVSEALAAAE